MTKSEAMAKIKALMKEAIQQKKHGTISAVDYSIAEDQLNDAHMKLQLGQMTVGMAEFVISSVENTLKSGGSAPASGNTTPGMSQEEYDKQKKAMYQKYKAGEITNYAYIQWKKQNDPSNQPKNAAASAPAAKKAQTAAPKPQAANGAAVSGMTQAEFDAKKKEMYQKYKNGEITNYAYIQWKKQNDPSKQASVTAQTPKQAAPAAGTGKKKQPMTEEEYKALYNQLMDKAKASGMDVIAQLDLSKKMMDLHAAGGSVAEAEKLINGIQAQSTPNTQAITNEQLKQLKTELAQKYANGDITYDELNEIGQTLHELQKAGFSYNDVGNIMSSMADGDSLEKAAQVAGVDLPETMKKPTYAVSDAEVTNLLDDLYKKVQKGTIKQEEYEALANKAMQLQTENKNLDEIKAEVGLDPGTLAAEKAVNDLTDELYDVYGQAAKELKKQSDEFVAAYAEKMKQKQQDLLDGKITQAEYDQWVQNQLKTSELMQAKIDQMSETMLQANKKAVGMINGETLGVFAENANYQAYQITQDAGVNLSFAIYDENTVKKLVMEKPELLPRKVVNGQKDKAWNQKEIAGAITQAVLQGESIPKLAKRIARETASTNMKAMVRYARTAMTCAQNAGRMEMLHQAKGMGIGVKKRWLATLDGRTRDSHRKLDGKTIDVDEPFVSEFGKIMFPGDPEGAPGDVYNCRCTLVYDYEGFPNDPSDDQRLYYDEYYTTETDENGNEKKVFHRESHLITDMNYDEWKAAKEGSKLNDLNLAKVALAEAQKAVLKANISETKQYKDIWKDPVTLADYEAKKDAIQGKRDYYETEIQKYKDAIANGSSWATEDKLKELQKKLKLLNEFETNGKLLADRNKALKDVQDIFNAVGFQSTATVPNLVTAKPKPKTKAKKDNTQAPTMSMSTAGAKKTQFAPDAWDAKTKKAARNFNSKVKADKVLRPELDAIWDNLTDEEKYGVWLYTWNSHPMNKPLSGHHDGWDRSYFIGFDKAVWGHEDDYSNRDISFYGEMGRFARKDGHAEYKKGITYATTAIEKSTLREGQWLVRGSDENGLAGWFAGAGMDFSSVTDLFSGKHTEKEMQNALVGKKAINHAFTSTGIATGTGFGGNVSYRIYAPKGTKGIYAEPQSHYGDTTGGYGSSPAPLHRQDMLYKKGEAYKSVGDEAEIIIQRGTTYVCTGLKITGTDYRGRPKIEIEMEIVEQPDYFVHGDEDTYNGGKTRHKR